MARTLTQNFRYTSNINVAQLHNQSRPWENDAVKWFLAFLAMIAVGQAACAAEVVALGASNTEGRGIGQHRGGVDRDQAFPAQLEQLLRQQKCDVSVLNAGVPGDTTAGLNQRLPGVVSADTKVLILETVILNDRAKGLSDTKANVAAIMAYAQSHGITVIPLSNPLSLIAGEDHRDPDGQHFDAGGHLNIAKYLLPRVRKAVGCR
jgi:acyl-CoA thioesterase-1